MSPGRTPNPDPDAEAHQRRHATAKAKKLLREGMVRLQAALDDKFIIDETPLEARDAMQLVAEAMHAALQQLDAAREQALELIGAGEKSRTPDLRITNALLYQLSYTGAVTPGIVAARRGHNGLAPVPFRE